MYYYDLPEGQFYFLYHFFTMNQMAKEMQKELAQEVEILYRQKMFVKNRKYANYSD